jgi:hypothetical protein
MKRTSINVTIALFLGFGLTLVSLWLLGGSSSVAQAQGPDGYSTYYVAPSCTGVPLPCYTTLQSAVDAADDPEDVVKVAAGTYTGVNHYGGLAQVVYISKTVTVRGGYTTTNWTASDPDANPTTLDAQRQGRVFYIAGDPSAGSGQAISPTIEGLRITGGDATGLGGGPGGSYAGGGVYAISATPAISHNWVFSNTAGDGGGLFMYDSNATLSSNTINDNTAVHGGGLVLYNTAELSGDLVLWDGPATLSGNSVTSNTADLGGGLCLYYSDAQLSGNTVASNTADNGGGLYVGPSHATLSGSIVISNAAEFEGGGMLLEYSGATLNDNVIAANAAHLYGGGLSLEFSPTTLLGNTITRNVAYSGGGLLLHSSATTLSGNTVTANTAEGGGGLYLSFSDATLSGNVITANTVQLYGGGLYLYFSDAMLTNNLVADNRADAEGSGVYARGSSPRLLYTTVARNRGGDGSGIYLTDGAGVYSTVVLTNTILVSHTVGITVTPGNTATLEATLWGGGTWANGTDWDGAGAIVTGLHNYWGDPVFVNPDAGDYHIGPGSAALDRGVDAGVTVDIDGDPRPSGAGYDLGADEFSTVVSTENFLYLPVVLRQSP